ncbi:MAG: type II secretion system protein GspM, partial [Candidatus Deferrimicrobiaceae bacterium]
MLRDREKRVLVLGGAVAAFLLLLTFVVFPGVSRIKSQSRAVAAAEADLAEVRRARPEIERIRKETEAKAGIVRSAANVKDSPLSRVTSALQEAGIPPAALNIKSGGARDGESFRE